MSARGHTADILRTRNNFRSPSKSGRETARLRDFRHCPLTVSSLHRRAKHPQREFSRRAVSRDDAGKKKQKTGNYRWSD
jgi:hypothetical protein